MGRRGMTSMRREDDFTVEGGTPLMSSQRIKQEGLPDLKAKGLKKSKQRAASKGNHASEALEQLTRQTREAVRELKEPTATMDAQGDDMDPERMVEGFVNLLYPIVSPLFGLPTVRGCARVRVWGFFGDSDRMHALAGLVGSSSRKGEGVSFLVEAPDSGSRGFRGDWSKVGQRGGQGCG
ncbi:hypothetical protein QJS10_CPB21g01090 [Acorus calamus]|uniref:Uncharacterized protein n=1 Tax=Acorus calamus TaxID=4465 RepID=A0AAV9C2Q9_ACOCL|nr:hypothetical protein QJS10_CPB21g01090 [Acorus calamus]